MHWSEKTPILFYNQERMCESNEPQEKKNFELKGLVPMKNQLCESSRKKVRFSNWGKLKF